jgi:cytidyltransferase-like protein
MALRLPAPAFENKIVTFEELAARRAQLPGPVVMTNGVFDILHRGHVTYLAQARDLGKSLIVAVNSDASVKMLGKGDDRPINKLIAPPCSPRLKPLISLSSLKKKCR